MRTVAALAIVATLTLAPILFSISGRWEAVEQTDKP